MALQARKMAPGLPLVGCKGAEAMEMLRLVTKAVSKSAADGTFDSVAAGLVYCHRCPSNTGFW